MFYLLLNFEDSNFIKIKDDIFENYVYVFVYIIINLNEKLKTTVLEFDSRPCGNREIDYVLEFPEGFQDINIRIEKVSPQLFTLSIDNKDNKYVIINSRSASGRKLLKYFLKIRIEKRNARRGEI
ncbi:hypothetical protein CDIK_0783 [Cucumispora dikerogammari]|nr:hypothetical protein CDIK_0783 [Cucumispora dikerogammari]